MRDEIAARRAACTDSFQGNGLVRPADLLATIDPDTEPDLYGEGGAVAVLEREVATLLGKEAAVFLPSGTMAQAATLRVHADARATRTVLWHPMCHLANHEAEAYARLHNLVARLVGEATRLIRLDDLTPITEPFAALLLELPQRDLGGRLPAFDELTAQVDWARRQDAAVHLDGARLFEAAAGYDRSPAEIAALFDTVYISFYKAVGALPGCCLAGPAAEVAQVKEWRKRLGGTLYALWPAAASARALLPRAMDDMRAALPHARAIAEALAAVPGVRPVPAVPETPMMHLLLSVGAERYAENARRLAETDRLWVWPAAAPTDDPEVVRVELSVGRATMRHDPNFLATTLARLVAR